MLRLPVEFLKMIPMLHAQQRCAEEPWSAHRPQQNTPHPVSILRCMCPLPWWWGPSPTTTGHKSPPCTLTFCDRGARLAFSDQRKVNGFSQLKLTGFSSVDRWAVPLHQVAELCYVWIMKGTVAAWTCVLEAFHSTASRLNRENLDLSLYLLLLLL